MASPRRTPPAGPQDQRTEILYVESSALLRVLLEGDSGLEGRLGEFGRLLTSSLTLIEVPRTLARAQRERRLTHETFEGVRRRFSVFARACMVAEITKSVRERAALEFPIEPVRSLDAIHLATIVVWTDTLRPIVVASCDDRVARNARALGYEVIPEPQEST